MDHLDRAISEQSYRILRSSYDLLRRTSGVAAELPGCARLAAERRAAEPVAAASPAPPAPEGDAATVSPAP